MCVYIYAGMCVRERERKRETERFMYFAALTPTELGAPEYEKCPTPSSALGHIKVKL